MSAGMPALTASVKAQLLLRLVDLEPASCLMTGGRFWPDGAIDAGMSRLVCPSLAKSLANQNLWKDMLARLEFKIGKWHCIAGLNLNVMERKKINFFLELDVWSFQSNGGSFQHLCQPLMTWQEGQGGYTESCPPQKTFDSVLTADIAPNDFNWEVPSVSFFPADLSC